MKARTTWFLAVVVAVLAGALVLAGTRQGPGLSPDSANYVSGARNLAAGRGLVNYSLRPITVFPPGFPSTLALGDRLGVDPIDGARWLNAFALAALVILTFVLARRHVHRVWLAVGAVAVLAFASPTFDVYTWAWSDPVFCVIVVGWLLTLEAVADRRAHAPSLIVACALLASAAFAYRYASMTVLAASVVVIGVVSWADGWRATIRRSALFVAVSLVVPALIVARNLSEGPAFGPRPASSETVDGILRGLLVSSRGVGALAVGALAALFVLHRFQVQHGERAYGAPLLSLVVWTGIYLAYIVVTELETGIDPINNRLLSPIFASTLVLVAVCADRLLDLDWARHRPWVASGVAVLLSLAVVASFAQTARHAQSRGDDGQGYSARSRADSRLIAAARALPSSAALYTDDPGALYFGGVHQPIHPSPWSPAYGDTGPAQATALRRAVVQSGGSLYLALSSGSLGATVDAPRGLRFRRVTRGPDGALYRVTGG
jgi:hypothetical protein